MTDLFRKYRNAPVEERFLAKTKFAPNGCLEWQGALRRGGYGAFTFRNRSWPASRAAWIIFKGEIPEGLWVLHTCDNVKCVNIEHLYLGTPKQNSRDRSERCSRWNGGQKFSWDAVQEARRLYASGNFSQQKIADMLGVSQTQISKYVRGRQRTHR